MRIGPLSAGRIRDGAVGCLSDFLVLDCLKLAHRSWFVYVDNQGFARLWFARQRKFIP